MRFEKRPDLARIVPNNLLEDRHQYAEGVVADDRPLRYLSNILGLGRSNREATAMVYVKHDVDIRAAVANVDDVVVGQTQPELQLIDCDYLPVTRRNTDDRLDLARLLVILESSSNNVLGWHNSLQRGPDHLFGHGRYHVEVELIALDSAFQQSSQQLDIALQTDAAADLAQVLIAPGPISGRRKSYDLRQPPHCR